jgi:ABC-type glycerol-3-phosphate transport system substrate-binding protein
MKKMCIVALFLMVSTTVFAKKIEITFWHSLGFHVKEMIEEMADEYSDLHPDVEVEAVFQGLYEELQLKLLTAAVTRDMPDVAQVQYEVLDTYIENGILSPIDKLLDPALREDIPQVLWELVSRDGQVYAVPYAVSATMYFYNQNAFIRAGLDPDKPPDTWQEFIDAGKRLTTDTDGDGEFDTYAMMFWTDGFYGIAPFLWAHGGEFFNEDKSRINLTSTEMVQTIGMLRDLVFRYRIMPQNWTDWEGGQAFLTGELAMGFFTSAAMTYGEQNLPWTLRVAPLPTVQGRRFTVLGGSGLLNFAKKNKQRRAANDFIAWMVSKENTIRLHEYVGYIPVRESALNSLSLKAFHRDHPNHRTVVESFSYARPLPSHPEYFKINVALRDMLERVFLQGAEPMAELQRTEREINDMLQ